jgi:response regulator RpfG family c-di-GMP phosphodiesterase
MHIILVEDDPSTLALLEKNMIKWGYNVTTADNGLRAMEVVREKPFDIIVSDWLMPKMSGLELCEQVRALDLPHYVYVVLISSQNTRMDVVRGLEGGADDYLVKPINMQELRARLEIGCRVINLERELDQKFLAIKRNYYQTVRLFIRFLETYDKQLGSHCRRVGQLALGLAKRTPAVSADDYPVVEAAGFLHDIGLIGLPRTLFTKQLVELTGEEKNLYRSHPERGEETLRQVDLMIPVARIVRMHHEQPDGLGFPDGLPAERIPISAQIVSAASIYDNLVHRNRIPLAGIPEKLHQMRGYLIDSQLVELLLEYNMEQMEAEAKACDRVVTLDELKSGMVLSRDVMMKTGAAALPAETRIDQTVIEKLKHYVDLGNITGKVFIYKQV